MDLGPFLVKILTKNARNYAAICWELKKTRANTDTPNTPFARFCVSVFLFIFVFPFFCCILFQFVFVVGIPSHTKGGAGWLCFNYETLRTAAVIFTRRRRDNACDVPAKTFSSVEAALLPRNATPKLTLTETLAAQPAPTQERKASKEEPEEQAQRKWRQRRTMAVNK